MSNYIVNNDVNVAGYFDNYSVLTSSTLSSLTVKGGSDFFGSLIVHGNYNIVGVAFDVGNDYFIATINVTDCTITGTLNCYTIDSVNSDISVEGTTFSTSKTINASGGILVNHDGFGFSSSEYAFQVWAPLTPDIPGTVTSLFNWHGNNIDAGVSVSINYNNQGGSSLKENVFGFVSSAFESDIFAFVGLRVGSNIGSDLSGGSTSKSTFIGTGILSNLLGETYVRSATYIGHNIFQNPSNVVYELGGTIYIGNDSPNNFPSAESVGLFHQFAIIGHNVIFDQDDDENGLLLVGNNINRTASAVLNPLCTIVGHNSSSSVGVTTIIGNNNSSINNVEQIIIIGNNNTSTATTEQCILGHNNSVRSEGYVYIWGSDNPTYSIAESVTATSGAALAIPGNADGLIRDIVNGKVRYIPVWT